MAGGNKLCENSNPSQGLTPDSTTWRKENLYTWGRTENGFYPEYKYSRMDQVKIVEDSL